MLRVQVLVIGAQCLVFPNTTVECLVFMSCGVEPWPRIWSFEQVVEDARHDATCIEEPAGAEKAEGAGGIEVAQGAEVVESEGLRG